MQGILAVLSDAVPKQPSTKDLILQAAVLALIVVLAFVARTALDRLKKRHLDPVVEIVTGGAQNPDLREMIKGQTEDIRIAARSAATAASAAEQGRVEARDTSIRLERQIEAVRTEVRQEITTLDRKTETSLSEIQGTVLEHGKQLQELRAGQLKHTDQIARIETAGGMREKDKALHKAATDHLKEDPS